MSSLTESDGKAWAEKAQQEAAQEVLCCRKCKVLGPIDRAMTVWRNGYLLYGICDDCTARNEIVIRATERGIEVQGRERSPIVLSNVRSS